MIASDPYLMEFVEKFTEINDGSAYFADLNDLGSMILKDYSKNKIKKYYKLWKEKYIQWTLRSLE